MERKPRDRKQVAGRHERGVSSLVVLVALVALIAVGSLAIDGGILWTARNQLQNSVDAAALAAASNLIDPSVPATTPGPARAAAVDQAADHLAVSAASVAVPSADVEIGAWDLDTRTFDPSVDESDPDVVNAVRVVAALDGASNSNVPAFMSRVVGRSEFTVSARATAYLGYAGGVAAHQLALPIVIDCCKLRGSPDCDQDYCETVTTNPPNPCDLEDPQGDGVVTVSCLEFHSTPEQNACWTVFDPEQPSINTADMTDIIESGQEFPVSTATPIFIDNGTKTPVVSDIHDRFKHEGAFSGANAPEGGVDRYPPFDGEEDSWVVTLPVVECQDSDHCAGGDPAKVVGLVCFEIREVVVTPDKIIRGRFLCEGDPLHTEECDLISPTGGEDFDVRADIPVLVR